MGMVTLGNIMSRMLSARITSESPIINSVYKNFKKVISESSLKRSPPMLLGASRLKA